MEVKTGYLYHIKDDFFDVINDKSLMSNHEDRHTRPTYFTIKDGNIFWFIPLSSKVDKYKPIIAKKIKKYGKCKSIMIRKIAEQQSVILLQNAFPTLEKYIGHPHLKNGIPVKVSNYLKNEILENFKYLMSLKKHGNNLFFTNIDEIKKILLEEEKQ